MTEVACRAARSSRRWPDSTQSPADLSPLAALPRLERIILRGHAEFDVSTLAGIQDTVIEVPPRSRVIGADKIGPTSRLTRSRLAGQGP